MTVINAPPRNENEPGFIQRLIHSVYTMFTAIGGQDGVPRLFRVGGTPAAYDETTPDGYLKVLNEDGDTVFIPYWNE